METDELPVLDSNIDYRQVPPLQQKRTIAFVNHFLMRTVSFLNNFATSCESRLMELECKLERVEASLLILESQLSSIPWLDDKNITPNVKQDVIAENDDIETLNLPEVNNTNSDDKPSSAGPKACEDSRFIRFFKMIQFGVPLPAVKLKMETEGLDSSILDKPNSIIPGYDINTIEKSSSDDSNSS